MSAIDIGLCIVILIGAISGFRHGFLIELFSLLAILLGVFLGFKLLGFSMLWLEDRVDVEEKHLPYIAFAVVFFAVIVAVHLLSKLLVSKIHNSPFGVVDQTAGAAIGIVRTAFMLSIFLWILDSMRLGIPDHWTENSWIEPKIAQIAPHTAQWVASYIPFFADVF